MWKSEKFWFLLSQHYMIDWLLLSYKSFFTNPWFHIDGTTWYLHRFLKIIACYCICLPEEIILWYIFAYFAILFFVTVIIICPFDSLGLGLGPSKTFSLHCAYAKRGKSRKSPPVFLVSSLANSFLWHKVLIQVKHFISYKLFWKINHTPSIRHFETKSENWKILHFSKVAEFSFLLFGG